MGFWIFYRKGAIQIISIIITIIIIIIIIIIITAFYVLKF